MSDEDGAGIVQKPDERPCSGFLLPIAESLGMRWQISSSSQEREENDTTNSVSFAGKKTCHQDKNEASIS